MSFAALRASARRVNVVASSARGSRVALRNSAFRKYSTEVPPSGPAPKGSNKLLIGGIAAAAVGGAAFWVYASNSSSAKEAGTALKSGAQAAKVAANYVPTKEDYQKVYNRIAEVLDSAADKEYDDGSYGPVVVRLAWHSSGTYDKETNTGGSNYATMRFEPEATHGANAGLKVARDVLEPIKQEFPWISYGDLWTLAGVTAIQELGGPKIPWRPGRIDGFAAQCTPDGRLPDASQGADHVRNIFYRMGFNDQEIVALIGAHALGRCHSDRSGFEGPWTFSPTSVTNEFYKLLLNEKWVWKKWNGPKQLEDKTTHSLMMLPTDYVLTQDKSFKKWVKAYADSEDLWFKDFSAAVSRLFELGVPTQQFVASEPWIMKNTDEN
ncbi:cytochrome c peroxidase [Lentinus tigrinus ALCF2SS1-7]|uniref:Peroxidase n=1 Tax=Lentinus tigrinus ALCF2SS1-6 TaxID=1328759 RepID=A0A5C2S290_9APHY|nr:cytochrome c peroxidase [Lentinus tigrinus ALCF2SS1-6]RPD78804.1 cytochrome c peroxidase [Lentinus tigrinus ALCF2SS1-7]